MWRRLVRGPAARKLRVDNRGQCGHTERGRKVSIKRIQQRCDMDSRLCEICRESVAKVYGLISWAENMCSHVISA